MSRKLFLVAATLWAMAGLAAAEEIDAVVTDATRAFTKQANSPEKWSYGRITLDSKGKLVSMIIKQGTITPQTKVALGVFDEKLRAWKPGEEIVDGVAAELFKDKGKTLRMRVKLTDDNATVQQILVTNPDEKLVQADKEFDAIYKGHGNVNIGGRVAFSYQRVELDDQGQVFNRFALTSTSVTQDTKVAMGKYNEQTKRWEAGEDIPKGVFGDLFKDPGAKTIYIRVTYRDDGRGIAQILVRPVGDAGR